MVNLVGNRKNSVGGIWGWGKGNL